ncbi:MAG: GTP-sensing pleiotropic transcriptional regulator CodY [Firmicutes bacterium]|nr:GTP-sensing pleiotropic transcriptional regulator CodY [Bacillota bacterium]
MTLFKKVSKVTQLLQREGNSVKFGDLAGALRDVLPDTSVYIVSRKGKVLGYALPEGFESTPFDADWLSTERMPEDLATSLLKIGAISTGTEAERIVGEKHACIVPVVGAARRVGSVVLIRLDGDFSEEEIVLFEFVGTVVGMVIANAIDDAEEDEAEEKRMARSAIRSLSYSEVLAMQHIFDELDGDEGLLVASRIADQAGITRSVIVNALRKLSSANVIESRSLGMKGTYLRILNPEVRKELERQRYPYPTTSGLLKRQA